MNSASSLSDVSDFFLKISGVSAGLPRTTCLPNTSAPVCGIPAPPAGRHYGRAIAFTVVPFMEVIERLPPHARKRSHG